MASAACSRGRLQRRADRKPTFARKLEVARDQIHKRGGLLLITARFLPGGRTLVTMTCGVTHQPYRWFVKWDLLAVLIWATYGAGLAYVVGQPLEKHRGLAFLAAFGAAVIINVPSRWSAGCASRPPTTRPVARTPSPPIGSVRRMRGTSPRSTSGRCVPRSTIRRSPTSPPDWIR